MGARELRDQMYSAGFTIDTADGKLLVSPASALTADLRAALRACKQELVELLSGDDAGHAVVTQRCRTAEAKVIRLYRLTRAEADAAHAGGWDDAEIAQFVRRHARLLGLGFTDGDADDLAERLTLRDRDGDDRRMCVECAHAGPGWRCAKREAFLLDQLQRCPMFKEKPL